MYWNKKISQINLSNLFGLLGNEKNIYLYKKMKKNLINLLVYWKMKENK